jgi:charged multivesicular body protein 3
MGKEMAKTGLISEMTEDMLSGIEEEGVEEQAEEEVNKVLEGILGEAGVSGLQALKGKEPQEADHEERDKGKEKAKGVKV